MPDYPTGSWIITHDPDGNGWTAQRKTGIITEADSWVELLPMMIDAERLWDLDDAESASSEGERA